MKLTRMKKRWVFPGALGAMLFGLATLSSWILLAPDDVRERHGTSGVPLANRDSQKARVGTPLESLPALQRQLEEARKDPTNASARKRYALIHRIAALNSPEARRFLVKLAETGSRDPGEEVDRLAAVSALARSNDPDALRVVAARTSDPFVLAKINALSQVTSGTTSERRNP